MTQRRMSGWRKPAGGGYSAQMPKPDPDIDTWDVSPREARFWRWAVIAIFLVLPVGIVAAILVA